MTGEWPATPRRVVVTGMGLLTSLGQGVGPSWAGLTAGTSGVRTIEAHIHPDHRASGCVAAPAGLARSTDVVDGEVVWRRPGTA